MIKYEKTISKFKNKSYFNELLFKYNFWTKNIKKKQAFLFNTGLAFLITSFISFIPAAIFDSLNFSYMGITGMTFFLLTIVTAMFKLTTRNEIKQIENLSNEFVQNLKENHSILQDLAELVVDEKSKGSFLYLTDITLSGAKDSKNLEKLLELLRFHSNFVNISAHQEKRDKLIKSLDIVLDIKEKLPKEIENKQKLLEML